MAANAGGNPLGNNDVPQQHTDPEAAAIAARNLRFQSGVLSEEDYVPGCKPFTLGMDPQATRAVAQIPPLVFNDLARLEAVLNKAATGGYMSETPEVSQIKSGCNVGRWKAVLPTHFSFQLPGTYATQQEAEQAVDAKLAALHDAAITNNTPEEEIDIQFFFNQEGEIVRRGIPAQWQAVREAAGRI